MQKIKNFFSMTPARLQLYLLHVFNDGYHASMLLLLPFIVAEMHLNLTQAGLLGTLVNSLGIVVALPAAYLARKIGGLKTLLIALILYGTGYVGVAIAPNYLWLLPMFIFAGIGFGLFHPIGFALIARLSDKTTRGREMGNFTAIGDLGRIGIASLLTFIIVYLGWRTTTLVYACIALLFVVVLFFFFKATKEAIAHASQTKLPLRLLDILTNKQFVFITAASFLDVFASTTLFVFLPFLLLERGIDPAVLGSFVAAFFVGNFFGKATLGRLVDRFGSNRVFITAELLMALFIFLLASTTSFILIILCSIILGIFTKGTRPVITTMVSEATEHHGNFEKAFGLFGITETAAATISPVVLGFIADTFGIVAAFNTIAVVALLATLPILMQRVMKPKLFQ